MRAPAPMPTPCREWQGSRNKAGYGRRWFQRRYVYVHRRVWYCPTCQNNRRRERG